MTDMPIPDAVEGFAVYLRILDGLVCVRMKAATGFETVRGERYAMLPHGASRSIVRSEGILMDKLEYYETTLDWAESRPFEFYSRFATATERFKEVFDELMKRNVEKVNRSTKRLKTEIDLHNEAMKGSVDRVEHNKRRDNPTNKEKRK